MESLILKNNIIILKSMKEEMLQLKNNENYPINMEEINNFLQNENFLMCCRTNHDGNYYWLFLGAKSNEAIPNRIAVGKEFDEYLYLMQEHYRLSTPDLFLPEVNYRHYYFVPLGNMNKTPIISINGEKIIEESIGAFEGAIERIRKKVKK